MFINIGYNHLWFLLMWLHPSKFQLFAEILIRKRYAFGYNF
jgi:hypothetical protein